MQIYFLDVGQISMSMFGFTLTAENADVQQRNFQMTVP